MEIKKRGRRKVGRNIQNILRKGIM